MATEYEELRLTVTLVDNASAGLKRLRFELRAVEGDSIRFRRQMQDLAGDNTNLATNLNRVNAQTAVLAAAAGYAGAKVNELKDKIYEQITTLGGFSREVQQIGNAARLLGLSFGQLNSIIEQGKAFGLDEGTIKNITGGMIRLQAQLETRAGINKFRFQMAEEFKLDPQDLEAYIDRLRGATTIAEFLKAVQDTANVVEEKEFQRTKDPQLARELRQKWITEQGLPAHLTFLKKLDEPTQAYLDRQEGIIAAATRWNDAISEINKNLTSIRETLETRAMSMDGLFYKGLVLGFEWVKTIENNLEGWLKKLRKVTTTLKDMLPTTANREKSNELMREMFRRRMPKSPGSTGTWEPRKQSLQIEQIEELTGLNSRCQCSAAADRSAHSPGGIRRWRCYRRCCYRRRWRRRWLVRWRWRFPRSWRSTSGRAAALWRR